MNIAELARILVEGEPPDQTEESYQAHAALDRLLLRIFSVPSLMVQLKEAQVVRESEQFVYQLKFAELPESVSNQLPKLVGPGFESIRVVNFQKGHNSYTGLEFKVLASAFSPR